MPLPSALEGIFTHKQKSYKMILILALLSEMSVADKREIPLQSLKERFLALLQDREARGEPVDPPINGAASWADVTLSQISQTIQTPITALQDILEQDRQNQTIGFKRQLYDSWDQDVLIELHDYAVQELEKYHKRQKPLNTNESEHPPVDNLTVSERLAAIKAYIRQRGFAYPDHLIENFYLSLKSKPFVILAGVSGTGKTKLVKLFAEALGATSDNQQFTLIPVRPDWSDPSDLLGYKDLSHQFRPGPITEVLVEACRPANRHKPYFICLDEMNLARVEHYFSDMLSVLETQEWREDRIVTDSLLRESALVQEEDKQRYGNIYLPDNVYLIGTVNMDETTHPFSKKVLDRANTIEFNFIHLEQFPELKDASSSTNAQPMLAPNGFLRSDYLHLVDVYHTDSPYLKLIEETTAKLVEVNKILESIHSHVGFRIRDAICFYLIYNEQAGLLTADEAFDLQLLQKILPRIQGSSDSVKRVLLRLLEITMGGKLPISELIEDASEIWRDTDKTANSANYKQSTRKLIFMLRRLDEDGFTSYWLS